MSKFSHLHVHTQFSLLDGAAEIGKLYKKAITDEMPALAITDHGNMFGVFQFVGEAFKHKNEDGSLKVKPIVGCEFYLVEDRHKKKFTDGTRDVRYHQLLLAKDEEGYRNLCKLCSLGWTEGMYSKYPRIDKELIQKYHKGLIATTCCLGAEVPKTIMKKGAEAGEEVFKWWLDIFGEDYYIEVQRHHIPDQDIVNNVLMGFAQKYNVKVICTNDSHYVDQQDANAHDILLCINTGARQSDPSFKDVGDDGDTKGKRFAFYNDQFFFKTQKQMAELFHDIPQALDNTNEIIGKIKTLNLKRDILLPYFPIPENFKTHQTTSSWNGKELTIDVLNQWEYLRHLTFEGARRKYKEITKEVEDRLNFELDVIRNMGFPGYFLIVSDFIDAARKMGVFVGPGRGSAAGSAVAYAIGITNIDPVKYDLLFERFLNPERISMPDIDTDFDDEGRGKVIDYVVNKYGKNQVAQIVTYGTMAARTSIQDVARVMDMPINQMNELKSKLPDAPISLNKMLFAELNGKEGLIDKAGLRKEDIEKLTQLREILGTNTPEGKILKEASVLEGSVRNTGVHASAIIIAPSDLTELIPMALVKDSDLLLTQYEGSIIEDAGVLKMDFLGLKTLTQIRDALALIKQNHGIEIDIDKIPLDDEKTFRLYQKGETNGTFQFESPGMQKHLQNLKPDKFEDLIAMNALYRPGPMEYIPAYIQRKHGKEVISYDIPEMKEYLAETYGITVYQEQVMLLSQSLAGFSKGDADVLRKAMGKKQIEVLNKMKSKFLEGATAKGFPEEKLNKIWTDWEAFAQYAFNKSHSTCYAFVAYQTAYLKAHYPAEFMAAVLNDAGSSEKITFFIEECKRMGIEVLKPNVNQSDIHFSADDKGRLIFGLSALSGIGEAATMSIVEERKNHGEYRSIFDFVSRVSGRSLSRKTMEVLAKGGGFDCFPNIHRAQYFASDQGNEVSFIEKLLKFGQSANAGKDNTMASLFGDMEDVAIKEPIPPVAEKWYRLQELELEKEVAGFYLSGHPLDDFKFDIEKFTTKSLHHLNNLGELKGQTVTFACIVNNADHRVSNRDNKPYGNFMLEDYTTQFELRLYGEEYLKNKYYFEKGAMLLMTMSVTENRHKPGMYYKNLLKIELLADVRKNRVKGVKLNILLNDITPNIIYELNEVFKANPGEVNVKFNVVNIRSGETIELKNKALNIEVTNDLIRTIERMQSVELIPVT